MKKTRTDRLSGGEVLAKPVENEAGIVLYGAGAQVTDALVRKLQSLQVESVYVEGAHETRMSRDDYRAHVAHAFSKVDPDSVVRRLRGILERHVETLYGESS